MDIITIKSSDPKEISLSTKDWGYWYDAFQQLFANHNATVVESERLMNYWSGPYTVSTADPAHKSKWGCFTMAQPIISFFKYLVSHSITLPLDEGK